MKTKKKKFYNLIIDKITVSTYNISEHNMYAVSSADVVWTPHDGTGNCHNLDPVILVTVCLTILKGGKFLKKLWCCISGRV